MMGHSGAIMIDPYGSTAGELLRTLQSELAAMAPDAVGQFYAVLRDAGRLPKIIEQLSASEFEQLQVREVRHLGKLVSADLDRSTHLQQAKQAGSAHRLTGVSLDSLIEAYVFYQERIYWLVQECVADVHSREPLLRLVVQRMLRDLQGQVTRYADINAASAAAFAALDRHVSSAENLADLVRGTIEIVGSLPGSVCAFFARVDELGELQVEQSFGAAAETYHRAMETGEVPKLSIDPLVPAGQGPGGRAWRSGQIVVSDAWMLESDKAPWWQMGQQLGFRASAAVPLLDESGRSIALLSLYSAWPGLFSTETMQGLLSHVQHRLSDALERRRSAMVVPLRSQQTYRQMLNAGQVQFHYQPIIDLHTGGMVKLEALARMCHADGTLVSPQRFLPALGAEELLRLFECALEQVCLDARTLREQSIDVTMAINFPAAGFGDPRYAKAVFATLGRLDFDANRLQLEVLETPEGGEWTPAHQQTIQDLRAAGVQIAQDDLGAGHSTLLRMDRYPFDEVKIDGGLVRGALQNPKRAVEFMLYLTRLAHAFDIPVTIEGLENIGLLEAAAILGADRGQGYGIARPMPVADVPRWREGFDYQIDAHRPTTAIGAMAAYLLWDMQISTISDRPELIAQFVGARAIVDAFIHAHDLTDSPIDRLLARNQELATRAEGSTRASASVRAQVIDELTRYWLEQVRAASAG